MLLFLQGETAQVRRITELEQKVAELEQELAAKAIATQKAAEAAKALEQNREEIFAKLRQAAESAIKKRGELEAAHRALEAAEARAQRCEADMQKQQAAEAQLSKEKQRLQLQIDELRSANQQLQQRVQVPALSHCPSATHAWRWPEDLPLLAYVCSSPA